MVARIKASAAAIGVLTAASAVVTFAADADVAEANGCDSGNACTWDETSYKGRYNYEFADQVWAYQDLGAGCSLIPGKCNNSATSVYSNGQDPNYKACFYKNGGFDGDSFCLTKQTGDQDLGNSVGKAPGGFNDDISSADFVRR